MTNKTRLKLHQAVVERLSRCNPRLCLIKRGESIDREIRRACHEPRRKALNS
jgi:hypothetical protein